RPSDRRQENHSGESAFRAAAQDRRGDGGVRGRGKSGALRNRGRIGMKGTTPAGAETEREAAAWVRAMFGRVARRYDLANHLLSFNLDRYWRARTVAGVRRVLRAPESRALDLCCGTGDLLLALEADRGGAVWGADFCHPMLTSAGEKVSRRGF